MTIENNGFTFREAEMRLGGTHLFSKRMSLTTDSKNVTLKSLQKT